MNKSKWQGEIKFLSEDNVNLCIMQIIVWNSSEEFINTERQAEG